MASKATDPVGFFDSGRGGLCVLEAGHAATERERSYFEEGNKDIHKYHEPPPFLFSLTSTIPSPIAAPATIVITAFTSNSTIAINVATARIQANGLLRTFFPSL